VSEPFGVVLAILAIAAGFAGVLLLFLWAMRKSGRISVQARRRIQLALILFWGAGGSALMAFLALLASREENQRELMSSALLAVFIAGQGLWLLKKHRDAEPGSTNPPSPGTSA